MSDDREAQQILSTIADTVELGAAEATLIELAVWRDPTVFDKQVGES